jgi:hypothetical protein
MSVAKRFGPAVLACLGVACLAPKYDIDPTLDSIGAGAPGDGGSSASGMAGAMAAGGAPSSHAGAPAGGAASAGASSGGKAGASGGGKGGANGVAGAANHAGAPGSGGTTGGGGASAGGAGGAAGGPSGGAGGASAGALNCPDELNGAAGTPTVPASTALVVLDDVVIHDATNTKILFQWQFADGTVIADTTTDPRPADKWSRSQFFGDVNKISRAPGAHSTFLACDGDPDVGSLKNIIPFTAASQYYEVSALFAAHDYTSATVTANVKLVTGGAEDVTCAAHALLYAISAGTETPNFPVTLTEGVWKALTLSVPATGFTAVGELGIRVTTYPCQ